MNERLQRESESLAWSWGRHEASVLSDYLVSGVEDPRVNLQSILSRHFIVRALAGERFDGLMRHEERFSAVMNWLAEPSVGAGDPGECAAVLHALRHGADNAEGLEIPRFVVLTFAGLPATAGTTVIPNYIEQFLDERSPEPRLGGTRSPVLDTFCRLWKEVLAGFTPPTSLSVVEPACGSANDYRCLRACGVSPLIAYSGFDLCETNVANARSQFPDARFEMGNVFEIATGAEIFDLCFVHDLFEHLSPEGIEAGVAEVCRVTRRALSVGFFNMDETANHAVRPVERYHWNRLSMARMKESFAAHGFAGDALHVGTYLRRQAGCDLVPNPNAYTFELFRR